MFFWRYKLSVLVNEAIKKHVIKYKFGIDCVNKIPH